MTDEQIHKLADEVFPIPFRLNNWDRGVFTAGYRSAEKDDPRWVMAKEYIDNAIIAYSAFPITNLTKTCLTLLEEIKNHLKMLDEGGNAFRCLNEEENGKKHRCKTQCSTCPELYGERNIKGGNK